MLQFWTLYSSNKNVSQFHKKILSNAIFNIENMKCLLSTKSVYLGLNDS